MDRLLVVKLADFGDALLTTPALRALRTAHPAATLDVLTTPGAATVFRHSGLVDDVLVFEKAAYDRATDALLRPLRPLALGRSLRARRYDAVVLLHHLTLRFGALKHAALALATGAPVRAGLHRPGARRGWFLTHGAVDRGFDRAHEVEAALAVAATVGGRTDDRSLAFVPGPDAEAAAEALLASLPASAPRVAVHPGSGPFSAARRWPAGGFARVADLLARRGAAIVLVGTGADGTAAVVAAIDADTPLLDLTDRTDLPTLAAVLARMDVLVGNDSGVTHLATAAGTPVVAVFGPSSDTAWGPWWPGADADGRAAPSPHRVVSLPVPCRPCLYTGYDLGAPGGCPSRDCLAWLEPEPVLAAAVSVLGEASSGELPVSRGSGIR